MTLKLYEVVTPNYGEKFEFTVGDTTKTLTLNRLSLLELVQMEKEYGVSIDNFVEHLQKSIITNVTDIAWKLLVEKEEFNNNIDIFRKLLTTTKLEELVTKVMKLFEDSIPVEKNEERPEMSM
jgi:hypothetical protein